HQAAGEEGETAEGRDGDASALGTKSRELIRLSSFCGRDRDCAPALVEEMKRLRIEGELDRFVLDGRARGRQAYDQTRAIRGVGRNGAHGGEGFMAERLGMLDARTDRRFAG